MERSTKAGLARAATLGSILCGAFLGGVGVARLLWFPPAPADSLLQGRARQVEAKEADGPVDRGPDAVYGRWFPARRSNESGTDNRSSEGDELDGLGYLSGYVEAKGDNGVSFLDSNAAQPGWTLFTSGESPVAYLMSLTGEIVHHWKIAFTDVWPDEIPFEPLGDQRQFLRRVYVFPNGDLLAIFEYTGIFKLDRNSNVLWRVLNRAHHDLAVAEDGTIVTLTQRIIDRDEMQRRYPGYESGADELYDDRITFLDPSGDEIRAVSLFDAFYRSDYAPELGFRATTPDIFHANSVDWITGRDHAPALRTDEVLVSIRNMSALASIDPNRGRVEWMLTGMWKEQHQARLLDNGHVLLLDNRGGNRAKPLRLDASEVLEIDPLTQDVAWRYRGTDESPFFTHWLGYVQRLRNGNTLVTESQQGRIFEVTPRGRIVWEYRSPHRAGDDGELIATVMGAQRIDPAELTFLDE